jgi:hypothetical protein
MKEVYVNIHHFPILLPSCRCFDKKKKMFQIDTNTYNNLMNRTESRRSFKKECIRLVFENYAYF